MFGILLIVIICLFIALLSVNLYFRLKILKIYRKLRDNQVEFPASYILKPDKLKKEIIPRYPQFSGDILSFSKHMRVSLGLAFGVFVLCCLIGYHYMFNR